MKTILKNFTLVAVVFLAFSMSSCSKDGDNYTPASDDVVDRPIPGNPDTEYAPQRPTPGGPNPE